MLRTLFNRFLVGITKIQSSTQSSKFFWNKAMGNVTIRDVAKKAGVGVGTVSRVLNESPSVRESTRSRVLAAIEALQYSPNPIARRLSLGKTHTIGVIAPFFTTPSCTERLRGIESALIQTDYDFMLFNVESVPRRNYHFQNVPRKERIDGLIIITLAPTDTDIARFERNNIPTVLIDRQHVGLPFVAIDDVMGGKLATQHLIDLGHRRIGFISDFIQDPLQDPFQFSSSNDRFDGYRQALAQAEIPFQENYHIQGPHTERYAEELAGELLSLPEPPTAIFATSDTQAIGVMQAAKKLRINIPADLSLIGYDDIEIAKYLNLTTIRQPLAESGIRGVQLLLDQIQNSKDIDVQQLLPLQLVVRNTTGPLKQ